MSEAQDSGAAATELLIETRGFVRWITFNRPHAHNSVTWQMYSRLREACEGISAEPDVRAVVLTGAGSRAFVAGTDISQFRAFTTTQDAIDYETTADQVMTALETVRVPTIAAIAGACTGAGAVIAACCDVRIGAPSARFGIPIARTLGNCLSMPNHVRLTGLLGAARLRELIVRARLLDAQEMLACGVLSEVTVDEESLPARAQLMAEEAGANAPLTVWASKEALRRLARQLSAQADDADLISACYASEDFREGVEAFLGKRRPVWRGR